MSRLLFFANTDWYLFNFRLSLARAVRAEGHSLVLASPGGPYARRLEQAGFRWVRLPISRKGVNPLVDAAALFRMARLYRAEAPDLVHHFTVKPVIYGSIAARQASVPGVVNSITGLGYVFVNHGLAARALRPAVSALYRLALSGSHVRVVFQTIEDRAQFERAGLLEQDRGVVIEGSGVDPDRFLPSAEADGPPVVLLAARMLWDKGVAEFVEAARTLRGRGVRARFILVGAVDPENPSSIPRSRLHQWTDLGLVEWWGRREEMPAVLAASHIVVLPSHGEGIPRVLLEAAASARPIVASDIPGCREVVKDGISGLLVRPGDATALADALERLIGDPGLRRRMGVEGRRLVLSRFTERQVNDSMLRLYAELLGGPTAGLATPGAGDRPDVVEGGP